MSSNEEKVQLNSSESYCRIFQVKIDMLEKKKIKDIESINEKVEKEGWTLEQEAIQK